MGAQAVTENDFAAEVLESPLPVLVDFWAEWCGPCRMVAPIVEEIGAENADTLKVVKLNVDENPGIARDYGIMSIPTLLVFRGGQAEKRIVGAKGKAQLLADLNDYLG